MQLRTYSKKNSIPADDIIEALTAIYPGTWLYTSKLNEQIIAFLDQAFSSTTMQLPAAKETLQLPEQSSALTAPEAVEIATTPVQSSNLPTSSSLVETLIQANLEADEVRIGQMVDASYQRVTNILGNHYDRVENELLGSLKTKYSAIAEHQKTSGFASKQSTKLDEFKALKTSLKEIETDIKS